MHRAHISAEPPFKVGLVARAAALVIIIMMIIGAVARGSGCVVTVLNGKAFMPAQARPGYEFHNSTGLDLGISR